MFALSKRAIFSLLLAAVFSVVAATQGAAGGLPGTGQHYPNGVEDFAVGALPPPGVYMVNYLILAQKKSLRDNSGNNLPADFKADVIAEVPRLIYVSPYTVMGASWGMHAFLPFYGSDIKSSSAIPPLNIDSEDKGLGDIIFSPAIFGWHFGPNLHAVAALDIYAPTGNYDRDRLSTQILSKNHWTVEPVLAVSYFLNGFDFSAKFMYDFNSKNDDYLHPSGVVGDLRPGQEFHFDWALGYSTKGGITAGLVGYNFWQTTDDEFNGVDVQDSKSRVGGIGVGFKYWPKQGPFSMTFKNYWEYGARNTPTGPQTQLKVTYAF